MVLLDGATVVVVPGGIWEDILVALATKVVIVPNKAPPGGEGGE